VLIDHDEVKPGPGDYFVQAVLNRYETYHLGNGKVVKLPLTKAKTNIGKPNREIV
jgi:hypothetical protein